ncbi:hypothetical protein B1A99_21850 [Cohnella sp. CIP 111063]|uniref:glycosyltransferase family 2 protein n=1 Tax=unclassified Cohnella TaxID=2636738 RepID=UPI000B8C5303|nr:MULTISPECIES: glycosyltransferase family 2 protein [unclassified Cohnella]OXS55872.1 hypothetical protein B1A99_21850 [Cohnella sp. CIP 111063]PRX67074.1 glycosyl transferase family 2 [Cohnella sp. SGD-V74]
MQPKVSMVVPCYNKVNYISEMLDSVLAQKWDNIEIILVNDGSNDGTREVIAQYEGRLQARGYQVIVIDQENQGVAAAVRNGLKLVSGEFVCIPDCDDLLHEEYVSAMVNALHQFPDVNCVVCDEVRNRWDMGFAPKRDVSEITLVPNHNQNLLTKFIMKKLMTSVAIIMLRKALIDKLCLVERFITHLSHTQEEQIWLPILASEEVIIHLRRPLYSYILRENSIITSQTDLQKIYQYAESKCFLSQKTLEDCIDSSTKLDFYCKLTVISKCRYVVRQISRNSGLESYKDYYFKKFVRAMNEISSSKISEERVERTGISVAFCAISNCTTLFAAEKKDTLSVIRRTQGRLIAYGAGLVAKSTLQDFIKCNIVPYEVWDIKAKQDESLFNIPLVQPDFDSLTREDTVIIFLNGNSDVEYKLRGTNSNIFYYQDALNDLSAEYFPELIVHEVRCGE